MCVCFVQHLEVDEPELYRQKVQYILENDVTDLELTFSEEDYDPNRTPSTIVRTTWPHFVRMNAAVKIDYWVCLWLVSE